MKILKSCVLILLAAALGYAFEAPAAGKWACTATSPDGQKITFTLDIKEQAGALSGEALLETGDKLPLAEIKADGNQLAFKVFLGSDPYDFNLKIDGNKFSGKYSGAQGSGPIEGEKKTS